jgi:hypothetical protein
VRRAQEQLSCTLLEDRGNLRNHVPRWLEFLHLNTEPGTEIQVSGMRDA